jgi:hypothetical protein
MHFPERIDKGFGGLDCLGSIADRLGQTELVPDIGRDLPFLALSLGDQLPLHRLAQRLRSGLVSKYAARRQAGQPP